jgi:hypothetical protein
VSDYFSSPEHLLLLLITQNRHLPIAPLNNQSINDRHTAPLSLLALLLQIPPRNDFHWREK